MQNLKLASTAGVTAGIAAATVTGGILTEVLQYKELLGGFGKFALDLSSVLRLEQLTGGGALGGNGSLEFTSLHGVVVIHLAQLRTQTMEDFSKSALSAAATIGDLSLQVTLTELSLIAIGGHGIDDVAELTAEIHIEVCESVAETVDILGDEIQTGFIPCGSSGVVDGKVGGEVGVTVVASAATTAVVISATAETASPAAAETAPAEEQQPRQECPHASPAAHSAAHSSIHEGDRFPGVRRGASVTDGIDVVNRYCFHDSFPFMLEVFATGMVALPTTYHSPLKYVNAAESDGRSANIYNFFRQMI